MNNNLKLAVAGLALAFGAAAVPARVYAQDNNQSQQNVTINVQSADVRSALELLFKQTGASYLVDQDVQGTVTLSIKDKPFDTVLVAILDQVTATYRLEGGIYHILMKQNTTITGPSTDNNVAPTQDKVIRRIKIMHADPELIFKLLSGKVQNVSGNMPETSTLSGAGRGGFGGGGFGGGGFGGGGFGGGGFGGGGFGGGGGRF